MGAGRKTQTTHVDTRIPAFEGGYISARNLRKTDLGGVIFGCKHTTMPECLSKQLFGLPAAHFSYVRNIGPGLPIFHFNYSDRKLHGIYESASHGQMCLDAYAWSDGGAERTAFPAQVRIRIREQCKPLTENEFKKVIEDNYYTPQHFWFELDHSQTRSLIALFKPCPPTSVPVLNSFPPLVPALSSFPPLPVPKWKSVKDVKSTSSGNGNKFALLSLNDKGNDYGLPTQASSSNTEEIDSKKPASNLEDLFEGHSLDVTSSNIGASLNEVPENWDKQPVDKENYMDVLLKLERLSGNCNVNSSRGVISESTSARVSEDLYNHSREPLHDSCPSYAKYENLNAGNAHLDGKKSGPFLDASMKEEHQVAVNCCDSNTNRDIGKVLNKSCSLVNQAKDSTPPNLSHETVELLEAIRELKERTAILEKQQVESDAEIQHLRNLHRNSGQMIQLLSSRFNAIESKIGTSMLLEDRLNNVADQFLSSEDSIYLIGGYSGSAWLSALDSFSPSLDCLTPLKSMSYARSYASVVALNGVIYALGGGDGSSWYDTVERYDRRLDEWTSCPTMIHEKGSLAGATLNGKIYAIGGGDGTECFSDVEMFDPALGRWIPSQSMLAKRFAPAAAELNGVIYAVGGYDGQNYLKSAERLDPREVSCVRIPSMTTRRGCHSMAVLNEKLFVMGGYDGDKMVSNVEIYDPRANAWMPGEPMKSNRGYGASALLGNSLFVIGGIENGETIVETIECYKEGVGWNNTRLKAVGKRCFFSAIAL